jgi:hypothetical protein
MNDCPHKNLSWPRTYDHKHDYQRCLDCGSLLPSKIKFSRPVRSVSCSTANPSIDTHSNDWYQIVEALGAFLGIVVLICICGALLTILKEYTG